MYICVDSKYSVTSNLRDICVNPTILKYFTYFIDEETEA